jgi:hypothetical protein
LAKNAFATTRLPTHKQGMADFQRTLISRLTGIYHLITVCHFACNSVVSQSKI